MDSRFDPGALLAHSYGLPGGARVCLRLARSRDLPAIARLCERSGESRTELELARLVRCDPRRRLVIWAKSLIGPRSRRVSAGFGVGARVGASASAGVERGPGRFGPGR